jgi:DNA-3-methyladenine glycosylase
MLAIETPMHSAPVKFRIRRLRRSELPVGTLAMARFLIGKTLVRELPSGRVSGRIVETEAYPVGDASGHAFGGRTKRNSSLFLGPGHAYVYLSYGVALLLNVSSEAAGIGAGVLIRALEPLDGVDVMERRRGTSRLLDLARGPGRLTQALAIDARFDGVDLCSCRALWLGTAARRRRPVGRTVRIGLTREREHLRRFYERGNPYVSGPKRLLT